MIRNRIGASRSRSFPTSSSKASFPHCWGATRPCDRVAGSLSGFKSGESLAPGETVDGVPTDDPEGYDGTTVVAPAAGGAAYSTVPSVTAPEPQQPPLPRFMIRLCTRPKNPHGLNRPVPLPQFASGPDVQPLCKMAIEAKRQTAR